MPARLTPRATTFLIFGTNGAMIGTWVAHIPWLQGHLHLSKTMLGLCLLCMAAGALVSMPVTGHVLQSRASATVTRTTTLVFCLLLPLPLLATGPVALGAILFAFGASNGAMDVAMNAHGVAVEKQLRRPIMSSLHGGWSLGGFAGAGLVALTSALAVDPRLESLLVGAALWGCALVLTRRLGSASVHSESSVVLAVPSRAVLLIGALCFLALLIEGGIADWSGIYLRQGTGASAAAAALAFTGFSLGMAVGRLGGDALTAHLGAGRILRAGMALLAVVLGAVLALGEAVPAVVGLALCGLGVANAIPVLFSAAGRLEPSGPSLAAAFTLGYLGFIVGPPLIGISADRFGLPGTLWMLVLAALAVTALGGRATEPPARHR